MCHMHPGQAQTEDYQSQDQAHHKASWTLTFGCLWPVLYVHLRWPSLLHSIVQPLHTLCLCLSPFWSAVESMQLSQTMTPGGGCLDGIWCETISVQKWPGRIQRQDPLAGVFCLWNNIQTMPSLSSPYDYGCHTHDPDYRWQSTI